MATLDFEILRPAPTLVERAAIPFSAALLPSSYPGAALPTRYGEWLLRSTGGVESLSRPAAVEQTVPTYPFYTWTGDTAVQVTHKGTIVLPGYEARTRLWDDTAGGSLVSAYGDALTVWADAPGGTYAGHGVLRLSGGGAAFVVGFALSPIPTAAGEWLYFRANY